MSTTERYDTTTIVFHWLIAVMVAAQWLGAHVAEWVPKGPLRVDIHSIHILSGLTLGLLIVARLGWRIHFGRRLPPPNPGLPDLAARAVQGILYLLVFGVVCGGVVAALARADSLFGVFQLPAIGGATPQARHAFAEQIGGLHGLGANLILLFAGGHATAALVHHYGVKDGVLTRMLPRRPT